ncbi:MAG: 50S ribosomal protein L6 [Dehalococcoidia bacterium]|nr:50S ribosomal protein L6 [Dehalococcoidia bacterium]
MSRIGRKPIEVPKTVQVTIKDNLVTTKGPLGELVRQIHPEMKLALEQGVLSVSRPTDGISHRSLHGLTRSLLANMVEGVSKGFQRKLELSGVGYRVQKAGDGLTMQVGFTHPVEVKPPVGITFAVEGTTKITISGIDKEVVGETAARIRGVRPPNPYSGKGVKYSDEQVRRKAGKAGKIGAKR